MPKFVEGFADRMLVPAGERDVQAFDDELPGFGIRKFADGKPNKEHPKGKPGRASYFVKFNIGRQQRRKTLGKVIRGNLASMRKLASEVLAKARLGTDVVADQRAAGPHAGSQRPKSRRPGFFPGAQGWAPVGLRHQVWVKGWVFSEGSGKSEGNTGVIDIGSNPSQKAT